MTTRPTAPTGGREGRPPEGSDSAEERSAPFSGKLILAASPFALVFLFLLLEWWIRGRS